MRPIPEGKMAAFNQQILLYQEEAYTLAAYLLGCGDTAAQAVQSAVLVTYQHSSGTGNTRVNLLKAVIQSSAQASGRSNSADETLDARLFALPQDERRAAVLVDVLGLSYAEAAQVLGCTSAQISSWLARARLKFMQIM